MPPRFHQGRRRCLDTVCTRKHFHMLHSVQILQQMHPELKKFEFYNLIHQWHKCLNYGQWQYFEESSVVLHHSHESQWSECIGLSGPRPESCGCYCPRCRYSPACRCWLLAERRSWWPAEWLSYVVLDMRSEREARYRIGLQYHRCLGLRWWCSKRYSVLLGRYRTTRHACNTTWVCNRNGN